MWRDQRSGNESWALGTAESGQKVRCVQAENSGKVRGSQGAKSWSFDFNSWAVRIPCRFQKLRGGFWESDSGGWWEGKENPGWLGWRCFRLS